MRFLFINHLHNATQSLRTHRLRTGLTVLGVTIGIASITAITTLASGAAQIIDRQVQDLDGTIIIIRPGVPTSGTTLADIERLPAQQGFAASSLTDTDIESVRGVDNVTSAAPIIVLTGPVTAPGDGTSNTPPQATIVASTPELEQVNNVSLAEGQFLDPQLSEATAVIGPQLSIDLFGTEQSIGRTVNVKGRAFTVIGVSSRVNAPVNYNGVDFDHAITINQQAAQSLSQTGLQIQQINVRAASTGTVEQISRDVTTALLQNHLGQADFKILSGSAIAEPTDSLFRSIALAAIAIAAISLLVGGVGIMNILLVTVAERTREIGIRKALGASTNDIVWQFLIESLALSVMGGIAGYILGFATAFVISTFLTFDPTFTWYGVGVAVAMSLVTGLLFGLYPAIRAARKDPIAALRHYE